MDFKTEPFKHQRDEWEHSKELAARAIFWEQGTGKSKLMIDTIAHLYLEGKIDAVIVVAPNGVHRNWVEKEIPEHLPVAVSFDTLALTYATSKASTKYFQRSLDQLLGHKGLSILTLSYDAVMTKKAKDYLNKFFTGRKVLYILDEAHYIKNPQAKRTKAILKSSKFAPFRRILTGTPIAQGAFDTYSIIKFLDPEYWKVNGFGTYTEFKHYFGIWQKHRLQSGDKREFEVLVDYRHLDKLQALLLPIASRLTKDDVLDLPPKLYQKRTFELSVEQARLYKEIKEDFVAWVSSTDCDKCGGTGETVDGDYVYACDCAAQPVVADLAITRLLRLQQITGGYLPTDDEDEPVHVIGGTNKRIEALMEVIEQTPHKVIVWARFQLDIDLIMAALDGAGIKAVRYDGKTSDNERALAKEQFQGERAVFHNGQVIGKEDVPEEEQVKVFVGNPAVGATGLTLTAARTVVYYSNSFKLVDRLQSEDRAHRIGQTNSVLYVDIIAEDTVDDHIVSALRDKLNIANQITGDDIKEWL